MKKITVSATMKLLLVFFAFTIYNTDSAIQSSSSKMIRIPLSKTVNSVGYYSTISIGTPPQSFKLVFETTFPYIWVITNDCPAKIKICSDGRANYSGSISSTHQVSGEPFFSYDDASLESGVFAFDTVSIGDTNIGKQKILEITQAQSIWDQFKDFSGVFGLGLYDDPNAPLATILQQDLIKEGVFSVYLNANQSSPDAGEILFGGTDPDRYRGELKYTNAPDHHGYWSFRVNSIKIADKNITRRSTRVWIRTGVPEIYIPKSAYQEVMVIIGAKKIKNNLDVGYEVDCASSNGLPNMTISIEGADFILSPKEYVTETTDKNNQTICTPAITISYMSKWILGHIFIQKYYSIFDQRNKRVGFAESIHK